MHLRSRLRNVLVPGALFTGEKMRGAAASVVSGAIAGGLNIGGVQLLGFSAPASAALFLYGVGSVLGYSLDILFAKSVFRLPGVPHETVVPYSQIGVRGRWLLRSFVSKKFFRFLVTVLLDTLIGLALLRALIDFADRRNVLPGVWVRDPLIALFVALLTFFLYNNILRFDWAYRDADEPIMNLVVLMWATLVLMIFAVTYKPREREESGGLHSTPATSGVGLAVAAAVS